MNEATEPQEFVEFLIRRVIDFGLAEDDEIPRDVLVPLLVAAVRKRNAPAPGGRGRPGWTAAGGRGRVRPGSLASR